jgi:hypothetical protein
MLAESSSTRKTLTRQEGFFKAKFENFSASTEGDGSYFIDRDPCTFRHILNFLRDGSLPKQMSFADIQTFEKELKAEHQKNNGFLALDTFAPSNVLYDGHGCVKMEGEHLIPSDPSNWRQEIKKGHFIPLFGSDRKAPLHMLKKVRLSSISLYATLPSFAFYEKRKRKEELKFKIVCWLIYLVSLSCFSRTL